MGCFEGLLTVLFFVFTFAVWCVGVALLAASIYYLVEFNGIFDATDDYSFTYVSIITLGLAGLLIIIGFLGCCGTCKKSKCMLYLFAILLLLLLLGQVGLGVAAFVLKIDINEQITAGFNVTMAQYTQDKATMQSWDLLQETLDCCGSAAPTDWDVVLYQNGSRTRTVPASCCSSTEGYCATGEVFTCENVDEMETTFASACVMYDPADKVHQFVYSTGCSAALTDRIDDSMIVLGSMLLIFGCFQLLGVCSACIVGKNFGNSGKRDDYY